MTGSFSHPGWLWLLLAVAPVWWFHRHGLVDLSAGQRRVSLAVRLLLVLCLVLGLSGLGIDRATDRQFLLVLADRSASLDDAAGDALREFVAGAWAGRRPGDEGRVIQFAEGVAATLTMNAFLQSETNTLPLPWRDRGTDVASALRLALAQMDPEFGRRVLLCTDGHATGEDPGPVLERIRDGGVRVDTWPAPGRSGPEVQVLSVRAPARVRTGEPFQARVRVQSTQATEATVRVYLNGIQVGRQAVGLRAGESLLSLPPLTADRALAKVRVQVEAGPDQLVDNNSGAALVRAEGTPTVLLIESRPQDARHLRRALKEEGIEVEVRSERGMPRTLSELRAVDLLCLSDVPATDLGREQMEMIRSYVRDFGGGFVMLGGDASFGLGGYYKTPVEEILPVRTDFERERETPSLAMVLVIDKSGSMGGQKIELAKEAAKATLELLDPRDQIAVLAFDGRSQWVCEMHSAADRGFVVDRISSLRAGGGTDLGPALTAAYSAMERTSAKLKHVLVLSDGHSTPGRFFDLVSSMRASGITVSAVGVGEGADRELLEQIAGWGNGRYYFTVDPLAIPQIFAKETMTASRSAIQETPFQAVPVVSHPVLRGIDWDRAPFLLGYVMTRPKPTGEVLLATERGDPLLSTWRYGLGTVVAFTSDAKARWAAEWVEWDGFSAFWAQVVRDTMRPAEGSGLRLRLDPEGDGIRATADLDPDRAGEAGDIRMAVRMPDGRELEVDLRETVPGRYEAWIEGGREGEVHAQASLWVAGRRTASASAAWVQGYSDELRIRPPALDTLRAWAELGGGRFDPDPGSVLAEERVSGRRTVRGWPILLALALLLLPLDIALRRIQLRGVIAGNRV